MNCHGDNKEKQGTHKHNPLKHMLHMVICCGLPIIIIALLPFIAKLSPSAGNAIGKITPFICPLMMLLMVPMMMGSNKKEDCCDTKKINANNKEVV